MIYVGKVDHYDEELLNTTHPNKLGLTKTS